MVLQLWTATFLVAVIAVVYTTADEAKVFQHRIISGEPAKPGSIPWQVILMADEYDVLKCGGSIIDKQWILTAAHCFQNIKSVFIVIGSVRLSDYAYNMTSTKYFIHPKYDPKSLRNDIALVQLPEPLKYSKDVQPISLPSRLQAAESFVNFTAIISGFGYTDDYDLEVSEVLLWAAVEIIENSYCIKTYGKNKISWSNICARGEGDTNKSICSGDSGGALVAYIADKPIQIGINSFVYPDNCTKKYPSVYVRTSVYLDYISHITGLEIN